MSNNDKKVSGRETASTVMVTVGLLAIMTAAFLPLIDRKSVV